MNRKSFLCLFDVDGTLTKPRQVITEAFRNFLLEKVQKKVSVGLVSGSDYHKIAEQLGGEDEAAKFDYVFCENGVMQFRAGKLISSDSILEKLGEKLTQRIINFALGYMSKIELPVKRGNFVEFRSSLINLCPVGRSCSQKERDEFAQYDVEHKIREKFKEALDKEFEGQGVVFANGGQISVDVFPVGWDKTYCLNHIQSENFGEIHFFGDKTMPGGNDHEIFKDPRLFGHTVTSPDDTKQKILECIHIED